MNQMTIIERNTKLYNIKKKMLPVLKKHEVSKAGIFGSFATGAEKKSSDIDILIEFEGEKSLLDLVALKLDLEEETDRKVDLLTYNSLRPSIKTRVLEE